ncbi:MAG TPA: GNAT family N-acetyltransferase [Longimicrobiaceae bacterium]|nr:GNAT family N-acetyltransferase [Longimicrobiaceae bacterium]
MRFRRAEAGDAAALSAFASRLFEDTYAQQNTPEDMRAYMAENFSPERQAAELADPATLYLLGEADGRLAAYVQLYAGPAPPSVAARAPLQIARFYVDPQWHGQGLAGEQMRACLAHAMSAGHDVIWLAVWKQNPRAIRFYEKHGFAIVGTTTFVLGADVQEDHVMMRPVSA